MTGTSYCRPKIGVRLATASFTALLAAAFASLATTPTALAAATRSTQPATDTDRIQSLLDNPVNGRVNLPSGTFTVRPVLRLRQSETIIGHHTTLKVAAHSGNYFAMLADAGPTADLSGLTITGVTFDQNTAANPITSVQALFHGQPRFVLLVTRGSNVTITNNKFTHTNNVNTIVTGSATSNVTISGNVFKGINSPVHDHSTIYTSGTGTIISRNSFTGTVMAHSAAIEVHGKKVDIVRNNIRGYYRGINIVCSGATVSHNEVLGTVNPVDLWSVVAPGLTDVRVTDNTLNRDLPYWTRVLGVAPPSWYTQKVIRDTTSTFPFRSITIHGNRG
jgi:hypothetical protein